jgi:hypothetical protein
MRNAINKMKKSVDTAKKNEKLVNINSPVCIFIRVFFLLVLANILEICGVWGTPYVLLNKQY